MNSNFISYALTAYALYNAITSKNKLAQQQQSIEDIIKSQDELSEEVQQLTTKTRKQMDNDLQFGYTLILGRPTSMKKLSGALHFSITNKSTKNTYQVQAFQFIPTLGEAFCNREGGALFNMRFSNLELEPGETFNARLSWNDLTVSVLSLGVINDKILQIFNDKYSWNKLGDEDATVSGACKADVWLRCGAPYLDPSHYYIIEKHNVAGDLRWHGGNYLPGNPKRSFGGSFYYTDYGQIMSYDFARKFFVLDE